MEQGDVRSVLAFRAVLACVACVRAFVRAFVRSRVLRPVEGGENLDGAQPPPRRRRAQQHSNSTHITRGSAPYRTILARRTSAGSTESSGTSISNRRLGGVGFHLPPFPPPW